jgi:hypothetical protein
MLKMKIRITNLIPESIGEFKKDGNRVRFAGRTVGKVTEFIQTDNGLDAIAVITDKKLISKLLKK